MAIGPVRALHDNFYYAALTSFDLGRGFSLQLRRRPESLSLLPRKTVQRRREPNIEAQRPLVFPMGPVWLKAHAFP